MFIFRPAADNVARGLAKFRNDILCNNFNITQHANDRMVQRAITIDDVIDVVKNGQSGKADFVEEGWLKGVFYHKNVVVAVAAPFGDYSARPTILTVFRDNEQDTYTPAIADLAKERVVEKIVEKVVVKAPEDLTDEELEALLKQRQEAKAAAKRAEQDKIRKQREGLVAAVQAAQAALKAFDEANPWVRAQVEPIQVERQPYAKLSRDIKDFEAAFANPIINRDGVTYNTTAMADRDGLAVVPFREWVRKHHPNRFQSRDRA